MGLGLEMLKLMKNPKKPKVEEVVSDEESYSSEKN